MKTFNTAVLAALAFALTAPLVPALAQTPPPAALMHGPRGGGRLKKMADELGLSDVQKTQMQPILKDARRQAQAIKTDTTLTPDARKAKLRDLHKSTRTQMLAILTPDQRTKMKSLRRAKRADKTGA